jgi:hypothetical protein
MVGTCPVYLSPFSPLFLWLDKFVTFFFLFSPVDKINSKARLCIASDPGDEI